MNRWWIYQTERFPLLAHSLLSLLCSATAMGYSLRLRLAGGAAWPSQTSLLSLGLIAALISLLFLLQLRVVDEFQAISIDVLRHPQRPVPRGLVTLAELRWLGFASGLFQFGLAAVTHPGLILCLLPLWGYVGMRVASSRQNLIGHLFSRALWLPLLTVYASAHDWLSAATLPSPHLIWLLGVGYLSALVIELGQMLRSSIQPPIYKAERKWPTTQAGVLWLIAVWLLTLAALKASLAVQLVVPVTLLALLLLTYSILGIWRFWIKPTATSAQRIEFLSGLWLIGLYCNLGILPLWL